MLTEIESRLQRARGGSDTYMRQLATDLSGVNGRHTMQHSARQGCVATTPSSRGLMYLAGMA